MERLVKIGFIGCGNHASHNLYPSLRFAGCELLAVADLSQDRRQWCRNAFGARRAYAGGDELLASEREIEAVFVSGPPELHYDMALKAMERGLHVFVEKPPATTTDQTRLLRDASRRTGRFLAVGFMKRFGARYRQAMELASRPEFGRKTHLLLRYSHGARMSDLRAMLTGMSIHAIDLARHFMGDVRKVQVERGQIEGTGNYAVNLLFESGASGTVVMNSTLPGVMERLELSGDGAFLVVDNVARLEYYPRSEQIWSPPVKQVFEPNMPLQTIENYSLELQGYVGEVVAFISAIRTGMPPALGTIDDAYEAMRIIDVLERLVSGQAEIPAET
jgi:myo-inositol 2-dehydrogenase/D-chiro-inositol 1-dehydrogenase